jgi:hypothetical protein
MSREADWAAFLRERHLLILVWMREGKSLEQIARTLSMVYPGCPSAWFDVDQVRLIAATPEDDTQAHRRVNETVKRFGPIDVSLTNYALEQMPMIGFVVRRNPEVKMESGAVERLSVWEPNEERYVEYLISHRELNAVAGTPDDLRRFVVRACLRKLRPL